MTLPPRACLVMLLFLFSLSSSMVFADYNAKKYRPYSLIEEIEPYLAQVQSSPPGSIPSEDIAKLWTRAGDAYEAARNKSASLNARRNAEKAFSEALLVTPTSKEIAGALMLSRVKLSDSLRSSYLFDEARQILSKARKLAGSPTSSSASVIAALWRAEASIERCAGRIKEAIIAWDKGAPGGSAAPGTWPSSTLKSQADVHLALDLWTTLGSSLFFKDEDEVEINSNAQVNDRDKEDILSRRKRIANALMAVGPWERPTQLPRNYTRGLRALPWHMLDEEKSGVEWEVIKNLVTLSKAAAPSLLSEWKSLPSSMRLVENECIADLSLGKWTYSTVNAPWIRDIDQDGCSIHTPIACALLRKARSLGMGGSALRGTYSSLAGGTRLRPHCGMTNAQIKLHIGLEVPIIVGSSTGVDNEISELAGTLTNETGNPCAFLTVSGEKKAWRAGEVLVFDDSFEHYVTSHCHGERTIFQLVVPHPEIPEHKRDIGKGGLSGGD